MELKPRYEQPGDRVACNGAHNDKRVWAGQMACTRESCFSAIYTRKDITLCSGIQHLLIQTRFCFGRQARVVP